MGEATIGVEVPVEIRRRLCLVLDVDDLVVARRTATRLAPWFSTVKVGLELFTAAGPEAVATFVNAGFDVFCDLKLHDIPNTVGSAAQVLGASGARWATVHTSGGAAMLRAAVEGMAEGAERVGAIPPGVLGVTVLTSDEVAGRQVLEERCHALDRLAARPLDPARVVSDRLDGFELEVAARVVFVRGAYAIAPHVDAGRGEHLHHQ